MSEPGGRDALTASHLAGPVPYNAAVPKLSKNAVVVCFAS